MRRIALNFALAVIIISGCSKDKKTDQVTNPPAKIDAAGNYSLTTSIDGDLSNGSSVTYSSDQIPCMLNNKLTLNSDGSTTNRYAGNDTCYLSKTPKYSVIGGTKGDIGTGTWNQKGNNITLNVLTPAKYKSVGTITNESGKIKITLKDTLSNGWTYVTTYVRQ